jgi:Ca2+-binding EF-hand superfamily protein
MDLEKKGEINLSILKERFNPKGHPDVLGGIASVEEIFKQFCYTLDIYCSIKNIKDTITYKQFIEYYSGISSSILDDKYFENMLDGVWDFDQISTDITNDNINNNNIQEKMNNNFQNKKIDNGFSTDDIGINSLFLGEPTHIMPKSFGKRGFKKRISNTDAQFENNNNIIDNSNQNTRFNQNIKNDKYNNQVPINQENFNVIQNINFNKKTKMKYNPITNEYKTNDMESNSNNLINQNINNKDLDTQNHEKQIKDIIIASLNNFKNILLYIGSHSLFSFLRKLSIYDINHKGVISLEDFLKVSQLYAINLSENELKMIFDLFDKEKSGSINYNELVQTIIGNISVNRENLVKKVYNTFPKNNGDKVSINEIKLLFNYKRHPEVISGKKSEGEIFGEFLNDIENFKEFLENYKGEYDNNLCLDDFIYFYNIVGFGFDDDKMFEYMLNNCWNLDVNDPRFGNYGMRPYRNNIGYGYNKERNFMARAGNQIMNSKY